MVDFGTRIRCSLGSGIIKISKITIEELRVMAINQSLFSPLPLKSAIAKLGFVQADPIRAPARAQDLILRHRAKDYLAGDLDRRYNTLDIEEDYLYAYGFLPRQNWQLLHPRHSANLTKQEKTVMALARRARVHPRDLEEHLGSERTVNAWGGYSKVSTRILESLHFRGLLRIAHRQDGIKVYEIAPVSNQHLSADERAEQLVMLIAKILSPISESALRSTIRHLRYSAPTVTHGATNITKLLENGQLTSAQCDDVKYVFPTGARSKRSEAPDTVRFLAPFDPVVWDRKRFEHLWGWAYRFEAYTPPPKRKMGYYALPMLWQDRIIGWVNVSVTNGKVKTDAGYVDPKPKRDAIFRAGLNDEVERITQFLSLSI